MDANNNMVKSTRSIQKELNDLRATIEDIDDQNQEKLDALCDKIDELDLKIEEINSDLRASKNGKLLWKISNFEDAFKKAVTGEEDSIFSDMIYTGQYGYKIQSVAYLNGIAAGKGTHLSLYLVIHKSEHDAVLPWPFRQKVNFTLLDLDSNSATPKDVSEELVGNRMSSSFTRPKTETNPGWGFPKFVALEQLKSGPFIKEDSIFIKIEVQPYDAV